MGDLRGKPLCCRERELVVKVAEGKSNKVIAHEMGLAVGSVQVYLGRVFDKLDLSNRTEVAVWAVKQGVAA
ncbi:MAG TPA: LuxR C-terminal-related transcriptional regulator [Bryobacteraceae bacterium]|nr:LuxR C-terminal-related transcriptional regulator [Bryobacteraceae bacterium]